MGRSSITSVAIKSVTCADRFQPALGVIVVGVGQRAYHDPSSPAGQFRTEESRRNAIRDDLIFHSSPSEPFHSNTETIKLVLSIFLLNGSD